MADSRSSKKSKSGNSRKPTQPGKVTANLGSHSAVDEEEKENKKAKNLKSKKLLVAVENYVRDLTVLHTMVPRIFSRFGDDLEKLKSDMESYSQRYGRRRRKGGKNWIVFDVNYASKALQHVKEVSVLGHSVDIFPSILLLALVSRYDAFIHAVVRAMFSMKPEMLSSIEGQQLTLAQVLNFTSIEDAKDFAIEKEAEDVLRGSHAKQFDWLERRLNTDLKKGLDVWPIFIEATERRNLFTHTNGIVSRQYLNVCGQHSAKIPSELKPGDQLKVEGDYYREARRVFFEIGVKLAHVVWRKLCPEERDVADTQLNQVCLDLIASKQFMLAKILLKFACEELHKYSSDEVERIFIINYANACRLSGDQGQCIDVLGKVDWSASAYRFQLGVAVLKGNYKDAARLMKAMGDDGDVTSYDYYDWPLFEKFRESKEFLDAFATIFKKPFSVPDEVSAASNPIAISSETRKKRTRIKTPSSGTTVH